MALGKAARRPGCRCFANRERKERIGRSRARSRVRQNCDIKTNYKNHFKVRNGIRFSHRAHNIYGISESAKLIVLNKTVIKKLKGKVISTEKVEVGRFDHVYVSTAAFGGTIFWKNNDQYMTVTRAKAHK
jgi:hypothetical protein